MAATVHDEQSEHRYVIEVEGERVGFLEYQLEDARIALLHAETVPAHSGRGLAGQLTKSVLDDARARGLEVLPFCPYVSAWIRKHPEYAGLVPGPQRAEFGLHEGG